MNARAAKDKAGEPDKDAKFRHAEGPKRSEKAHDAILKAAQEVLADTGYQKASIERIAKQAGVGKQTIYRWWPSRAALFMEVYATLAQKHVRPPDEGSLSEDLKKLWKQLSRFYSRTAAGPALAGLLAEAQSDARVAEGFRGEFLVRRRRITLQLLEAAVARGEVRAGVDLERTVDLLAGAVWYRLLVDGAPPTAKGVEELVEQVLKGIEQRVR